MKRRQFIAGLGSALHITVPKQLLARADEIVG
jgi:hypothetical protein